MLVGGPCDTAVVPGLLLLAVPVRLLPLLELAAAVSDEFRDVGTGALLCYEYHDCKHVMVR
jgi:hypothetical protein